MDNQPPQAALDEAVSLLSAVAARDRSHSVEGNTAVDAPHDRASITSATSVPDLYKALTVAEVVTFVKQLAPALKQHKYVLTVEGATKQETSEVEIMSPVSAEVVYDPTATVESAEEVGDGNLNLVFRILDGKGVSKLILKQALPYVRAVGDSWPLTLDRSRIEAETLIEHFKYSPETVVEVLYYNPAMSVMILEDLSDCVIWRRELVRGHHYAHVAPLLGRYLAKAHFHTSDFFLLSEKKKTEVQRFTNVDMCRITEDLFFWDPYVAHERNKYEPEMESVIVSVLREDAALLREIAKLKHSFINKTEALLHGDIHSGSVFVDATRAKAIDAEFGFYGPMGFDIGTVVGNLLLNYVALPALLKQKAAQPPATPPVVAAAAVEGGTGGEGGPEVDCTKRSRGADAEGYITPRDSDEGREYLFHSIQGLWETYSETFLELAKTKTNDPSYAVAGFADEFVSGSIWADMLGYSGAEMIRRSIGFAHVADIDDIVNDEERLAARTRALRIGSALIKGMSNISSVHALQRVLVDTL